MSDKLKKVIAAGKFFRIFVVAVIFLLWGVVVYSSYAERKMVLKAESDNLMRTSQIVAEQTSSFMRQIELFLLTMDQWLAANPNADPRFDQHFVKMINSFRVLSGNRIDVRLVSKSGKLFYIPSRSSLPLSDVSDRDYYLSQLDPATRGLFIAKAVKSRVTKIWGIPISYPLSSENHGISVIFAALELPILNKVYEDVRSEKNGSVILLRNDKIILTRQPFNESFLNRDMSSIKLFDSKEYDGKPAVKRYRDRIVAISRIGGFPLSLIVTSDYNEVMRPWVSSTRNKIIFLLCVSSVLIVLSFALSKAVSENERKSRTLYALNTELAAKMELLSRELEEKQILVTEANHRVKNHMSQLASLVTLYKSGNDPGIFESLKAKIYSYSVLYEKLSYRAQSGDNLNVRAYFEDLFSKVVDIYRSEINVNYNIICDEGFANSKKVSVAGLILCELITNSVKSAFSPSSDNRIELRVELAQDRMKLVYRDNGSGFDYDALLRSDRAGNIGVILINSMVFQYKGSFDYSRDNGSVFTIVL